MATAMKRKLNICSVALLLAVLMWGCGGGGGGDGGSTPPAPPTPTDTTRPEVVSTLPRLGAVNVATNSKITATFSEDMDSATITAATFTVKDGGGVPVPATGITYSAATRTAVFTHANLAISTAYTATITTGVKDLAGNALAADFTWSFTTGLTVDITPPTVLHHVPAANAVDVALNTAIALTFSEEMNPATITQQTFALFKPGSIPAAGVVTYVGPTAFLKPEGDLSANTVYTVVIAGEAGGAPFAEDLAGNALAADYIWSFTTGNTRDTTPPTVVSTNPTNKETGVPVDTLIEVTFSEAMLPSAAGLIDGKPVITTFDSTYETVFMEPINGLRPGVTYTASAFFQDLAGNRMSVPFTWTFTTAP